MACAGELAGEPGASPAQRRMEAGSLGPGWIELDWACKRKAALPNRKTARRPWAITPERMPMPAGLVPRAAAFIRLRANFMFAAKFIASP